MVMEEKTPLDRKWDYGKAGDKYPVKRGEIWMVGKAMLAVGDLESDDHEKILDSLEGYGIIPSAMYTDPPWDKGVARSFRTKAFGKDNSRDVDFTGSFIPRILDQAERVHGLCCIEMGYKHVDELEKQILSRFASPEIGRYSITYFKKQTCCLTHFVTGDSSNRDLQLDGCDDEHTPDLFCKKMPKDSTIYDPCAGRGLTPIAAIKNGHFAIAIELNPRRLSVTIEKLVKLTGEKPQLFDMINGDS